MVPRSPAAANWPAPPETASVLAGSAASRKPAPDAPPSDVSLLQFGWPWYVGSGVAALAIVALTLVLWLSFGRNRDAGPQAKASAGMKSGNEPVAQVGPGQETKSSSPSPAPTNPVDPPGGDSNPIQLKTNLPSKTGPPTPSYPERKQLPGIWRLVSAQSSGKPEVIPDDGADFLITPDTMMGKNHEYYFRFIDGAGPARLEGLRPDGALVAGIFKIDGDAAKICLQPKDKGFPADFDPRSDPGAVLLSLQRQKIDGQRLFLWDFYGYWFTDGMNLSFDRFGRGSFFVNSANGLTIGSHSLQMQNGEFFTSLGSGPRLKVTLGPNRKTLELYNTVNGQKITLVGGSAGDPRGPVTHLNLTGPLVTNASLPILTSFKGLQGLSLLDASVDTDGVKEISNLTNLETLHISTTAGVAIGADALPHLARLTRLRRLSLPGSPLTGEGFKHLAPLAKLDELELAQAKITDAGAQEIAELAGLKFLNLTSTKITDAGLDHLAKLTRLQSLFIDETPTTEAGVRALQKALPKCKISNYSRTKKM